MSIKKKILTDLRDEMKKSKRDKMMPKLPMKSMEVHVGGDDPEAIKEGLKMAMDTMDGKGPAGEMMKEMSKADKFREARKKSKA